MSAHLTVKITAVDLDISLLFFHYGLTNLIGTCGYLYSVLGIHEATNFQTDFDHSKITMDQALLDVLVAEGKLNFLQLYVDSLHVHIQLPFKHPVTGALVTCHMSHPQYQQALLDRAKSYLLHMKDLQEKLVVQLGLQIKQV